jgi:hypothetical protein
VTTVVLVLVSIALCVTVGILLFGSRRGSTHEPKFEQRLQVEVQARSAAEAELEKRKKELEDHKLQLNESREQLKQAKRKLFEQKESERDSKGLARAREEIERSASQQLENVRAELAAALTEIQKLKQSLDASRSRKNLPAPEPAPPVAPIAEPEKPARKFRELSDADRERMQRLEQQASRERSRAVDLEREVKRFRARAETQHRVYVVTKGELDLVKDKFKALEKRLNRTLLERDLIRRALLDLERKSGLAAERVELTAEEIAASDRTVEEKAAAAAAEADKLAASAKARAESEEAERDKAAAAESDEPTDVGLDQGAGNAH